MSVKFLKKLKFIVLLFNLALVFCGFLFIGKFFKMPKKVIQKNSVSTQIDSEKQLIDELASCKSDLFVAKNELERLKFVPDSRKDVIKLMLSMRDIEQKIGKKTDFSADCVTFFSLASRIPTIQEYVLRYKQQMFKNNCNFANNEQIIQMIVPFQVKALDVQQKDEKHQEKWYNRLLDGLKYQVSKLFIKSKIQKSDLEIAIEKFKYSDALTILTETNFEKNDEFNMLYDAISSLKNIQQMINGIYDILRTNG